MRLDEVAAGLPVHSVQRVPEGVLVAVGSGRPRLFDAAVIATHPDQALLMLAEPTAAERMVLGAIPYSINEAQLHTDESVLPRTKRARASWNYLVAPERDNVLVTYDVTRLMRLDGSTPVPCHPRRPGPRRPHDRARRDDVRPSALHTGIRCRSASPADSQRRQARLRRRLPRLGFPRGRRGIGAARSPTSGRYLANQCTPTGGGGVLRTALYRTRITHLRRAPVHHYFEHRSYSWYVDVDRLPRLPRWLRPFARFDARDHFDGRAERHAAGTNRHVPRRPRHRPTAAAPSPRCCRPGCSATSSTR